jgi:hypothetical protein
LFSQPSLHHQLLRVLVLVLVLVLERVRET